MPGSFGEFIFQDNELADGLGLGNGQVSGIDVALDLGDNSRVDGRFSQSHGSKPVGLGPQHQLFGIQGHDGGNEWPLFANQHALGGNASGTDHFFQGTGGVVLPACGDNQFLLASGDLQEAPVIQDTGVTGLEVAILIEDGRGGFRVVVVAGKNSDALDQDFSIFSDLDGGAGEGAAHGAHTIA